MFVEKEKAVDISFELTCGDGDRQKSLLEVTRSKNGEKSSN
jgi:hypothetical protein